MSLWEYKHITSGPHGFATPTLLDAYLNQLGKDEWEIISYEGLPNNPLAFNGLARRTTVRDWTLETATAAAAKIEADKLRAEFAAKFQASATAAEPTSEKPVTLVAETTGPVDNLRKLRDTERDSDPDAHEGEDRDEWDDYDDDLPTFFEAIQPHLRKNQRGPGQSVAVTFLAKRWEQAEGDLIGALKECGFTIPTAEDEPLTYLEFEGDLYWLSLSNRHELSINTREKPRPVFRAVPGKAIDPSDPTISLLAEEAAAEQAEKTKREAERMAREAEQAVRRAEHEARRLATQSEHEARRQVTHAEHEARRAAAHAAREAAHAAAIAAAAAVGAAAAASAPAATATGPLVVSAVVSADDAAADAPARPTPTVSVEQAEELLAAIRQQMRRNRRGPGYSGSMPFLARALDLDEADLLAALIAVGLPVPENATEKPVKTIIGGYVYWLNKDARGGIWINGDEALGLQGEDSAAPSPAPAPETIAGTVPAAPATTTTEATVEPAQVVETLEGASEVEVPTATSEVSPVEVGPVELKNVTASPSSAALTAVRLLLYPNKRGSGCSAECSFLARSLGLDLQVFLTSIVDLGFALPATEDHKPTFIEHGDEIFWLNKNPKDGSVWINAKASKASAKKAATGAVKPRAKKSAKAE